MEIETTRTPVSHCPSCGKVLSAATGLEPGATPEPGDVSVCLGCTEILVFQADLTLKRLTRTAYNKLPREVQQALRKGVATARAFNAQQAAKARQMH